MLPLQADKVSEKNLRKQVKREKLERQQQEVERLQETLRLQSLLDGLGTDETRTDLCTGKYSSLVSSLTFGCSNLSCPLMCFSTKPPVLVLYDDVLKTCVVL